MRLCGPKLAPVPRSSFFFSHSQSLSLQRATVERNRIASERGRTREGEKASFLLTDLVVRGSCVYVCRGSSSAAGWIRDGSLGRGSLGRRDG